MNKLRIDSGVAVGSPGFVVLGLFRIIVGVLFFIHGLSGLFGIPDRPGGTASFLEWPSWWAGMIQLVAGGLVAVGFGTRIAALLCSGSMAYAFLFVHLEKGVLPIENGGEPAVLFCWCFFLIAALGAGAFALRPSGQRPIRSTATTRALIFPATSDGSAPDTPH